MDDRDRPRYLHLLSDREIGALKPVLQILGARRDEVLDSWHARYLDHFGDARTLTEGAFRELYGRDLDAVVRNLVEGDMEGFEADVRAVGHEMVERGVPFVEVVASVHLFEESAAESFQSHLKVTVRAPDIYLTFDKLSHCRMILIASAYFAASEARSAARVRGLEKERDAVVSRPASFHGLVGRSDAMRRIYEQIAAASGGQGAVLIDGESGTGKELAARAIHACRGSSGRPFVVVNCAALPRDLIESELFGHRKGAYTGAEGASLGLVRTARGGTLFLDEITEMAVETQAKLLRVIEERAVRPVGMAHEEPVDVRFVASTNRDPDQAAEAGTLRKDLFYRLSVHRICLPALRERPEDVRPLAHHFMEVFSQMGLRRVEGIDDEALEILKSYGWPGNVRELRNAIEHALTFSQAGVLHAADLPAHIARAARGASPQPGKEAQIPTLEEAERDLILRALESTGSNKVHAARLLRISRHRLYDKLRKFGLSS